MMKTLKQILILVLAAVMATASLNADGKVRRQRTSRHVAKRAFVVGVSRYGDNGRSAWGNIHGAEDATMLSAELKKQGFHVVTLTDEQATYANIKSSFSRFIKSTRAGDVVYVHFSTHGQPVEDGLNGRAKDEADGWDESIVPIDAGYRYGTKGYKGDKHLTDDEMNQYITQLRKTIGTKGALYIAMDACHSGEMSRSDGNETVRGTNEGLSRSGKEYQHGSGDRSRHYSLAKGKDLAPTLVLEACTSGQRNHEIKIDGKEYGSLSYNICMALKAHPLSKNLSLFKNDVIQSTQVKGRWPARQNLVIEE